MLLYFSEDLGIHWNKPQILPVELPPDRYRANGAGILLQLKHGPGCIHLKRGNQRDTVILQIRNPVPYSHQMTARHGTSGPSLQMTPLANCAIGIRCAHNWSTDAFTPCYGSITTAQAKMRPITTYSLWMKAELGAFR